MKVDNSIESVKTQGFDIGKILYQEEVLWEEKADEIEWQMLDFKNYDVIPVGRRRYLVLNIVNGDYTIPEKPPESVEVSRVMNFNKDGVFVSYEHLFSWLGEGAEPLISLKLKTPYSRNIVNMAGMFGYQEHLTTLELYEFDTSNVTNMGSMFILCSSLTTLDLSSFDTSNVAGMANMFNGCSSLTSLDLSSFDTINVASMARMFNGCSSLTSLDLSSFDTSNVVHMTNMFNGCSSLTSLDLSSFDTSNVTSATDMFNGCSAKLLLARTEADKEFFRKAGFEGEIVVQEN